MSKAGSFPAFTYYAPAVLSIATFGSGLVLLSFHGVTLTRKSEALTFQQVDDEFANCLIGVSLFVHDPNGFLLRSGPPNDTDRTTAFSCRLFIGMFNAESPSLRHAAF
jgi:hypothetical protein